MAGVHSKLLVGGMIPEYKFTANSAGVTYSLSSLFNSETIARYSKFRIVINAGVTISGPNGGSGNPASAGSAALDFSSVAGKTIEIVNNGGLIGGSGGDGLSQSYYAIASGYDSCPLVNNRIWAWSAVTIANGGCNAKTYSWATTPHSNLNNYCVSNTNYVLYTSTAVAGGAGANAIVYGSNTVNIVGNTPIIGSNGATGYINYYGFSTYCNCNCDCCSSCFVKGTMVTMYDGSEKCIEDVKINDIVMGLYGEPNIVEYYHRIDGSGIQIYNINGLLTSPEHPIVKGDKTGFNVISLEAAKKHQGHPLVFQDEELKNIVLHNEGLKKVPVDEFDSECNNTIATIRGCEVADITLTNMCVDMLYHLKLSGGSKTYIANGIYVAGICDDEAFLNHQ